MELKVKGIFELPESSFVPMTTYRLARPEFAWRNENADTASDIHEHAFCVPLDGEPASVCLSETREYYADRYGGTGQGRHGGAGRCGTKGNVQIKGIGRTPLVGSKMQVDHSYGGTFLQEAIREALAGEICHYALPFGSVRVYGITLTGTQVPDIWPSGKRPVTSPRALVARQAVIRPAHFMRAPLFGSDAGLHVNDVARTRAAIGKLLDVLRGSLVENGGYRSAAASFTDCLVEMSRRFAAQVAAAQAKRLVHGALSPANIAVDGRWVDYGAFTVASDYGRLATASSVREPDAWWQFASLLGTFRELMYYARKYLAPEVAAGLPEAEELVGEYLRTVGCRFRMEFAKLTGIPEVVLKKMPSEIIERFCASVQKVVARGNRATFNPLITGMPEKTGRFHLNTLLREAALCMQPEQMFRALEPYLPDAPLRRELVDHYWPLRAIYAKANVDLDDRGHTFLALNAIRVNTVVKGLLRPQLDERIEELVLGGGSVAHFMGPLLTEIRTFLADPDGELIELDGLFRCGVTLRVSPKSAAERREEMRTMLHATGMGTFTDAGLARGTPKCA